MSVLDHPMFSKAPALMSLLKIQEPKPEHVRACLMEMARMIQSLAQTNEPPAITRQLGQCPRCKKPHTIYVKELTYGPNEEGYSHWATCPVLKEPVLVSFHSMGEINETMRAR